MVANRDAVECRKKVAFVLAQGNILCSHVMNDILERHNPKLCPLAIHHSIHFMQTRVRGKFLVGFVMMCCAVQKDQGKKIEIKVTARTTNDCSEV